MSLLRAGGTEAGQNRFAPQISLGWENDFVFQTDYYFTNGMELAVWGDVWRRSPLHRPLLPHRSGDWVRYGLELRQDIFTPVNTHTPALQIGDRPYYSYWLVGAVKENVNRDFNSRLRSALYVGMGGRAGGGEWVQNGIHDLLPTSGHVEGWDNQSASRLLIDYQVQWEQALVRSDWFRLNSMLGAMAGTPYTYLEGGLQLYAGLPGLYPGLIPASERQDFRWYGFAQVSAKRTFYNATLQTAGNNDLQVEPNPLLWQIKTGLYGQYRGIGLKLGVQFITPEFTGAREHRWGFFSFFFTL